jgi:hypothetical protein
MSNLVLKTFSLLAGYAFWYLLSQSHMIDQTITVPITWFDIPEEMCLNAPQSVTITMRAQRNSLKKTIPYIDAVHLSAQHLSVGTHQIALTQDNFFVPDDVKLLHCSPSLISVVVSTQEKAA